MIVTGFTNKDPINRMCQKISSLWECKKQGPEYWNIKIHESRAKPPKTCTEQPDDDVKSGDLMIDEMTAEEIKDKLKEKGITTRLRHIKKLQDLFLNTLREEKNINSMSLQ